MPHVGSEIDANFYCLIHRMLATPPGGQNGDRRSQPRAPYHVAQRIAPWDGTRFPDDSEFVPVQCHDLTRAGFSFLAPVEPHFRTLVVEFGTAPDVLYLAAQVLRSVPVVCHSSGALMRKTGLDDAPLLPDMHSETGRPMFLVGCRLTRRLRKSI
jgi:hypothetical protein